jgi:hypothetical protein
MQTRQKKKWYISLSTESEFISVSDSTSPVMWSRNYLIGQGLLLLPYPQLPDIIYQDTSTIYLALEGQSDSKKTKHIAVRYFFIKNFIERYELKLIYLPTLKMLADLLTRPLQGKLL